MAVSSAAARRNHAPHEHSNHVNKASTGTPEHGLYAVVAFSAENRTDTPVTAAISIGGFRWKAPNGQTLKAGNSKGAARIAPIGFHDGGATVQPHTFRWKIPAAHSGEAASALKSALT
ncbi:hypothetical protein [Streptomyces lydicus]|uniref:hypothetical protein n=1 Tax=Streptomyces lydicus TaxID=47763 RepID=UPI0037B4B2D4